MRTRRQFLQAASAVGAALAHGVSNAHARRKPWTERREFYPQGVASGDPAPTSVILWTRRPVPKPDEGAAVSLSVEVSADRDFKKLAAYDETLVTAETDYTCRFLIGGLKPA